MSTDAAKKALAALLLNQAAGREGKVSKSVLFHRLEREGHKPTDLEGALYQMKELGLIADGEDSSVFRPEPYLDWMGSLGKPGELPQRIVPKPQTTSWPVIWPLPPLREWYVQSLRGAGQQPPDVAHAPSDQPTRPKGKSGQGAGGRRELERCNPLQFQVYKRIQEEHQAGEQYVETVNRLKGDANFVEQVKDAGLKKLDAKLVRKALAFFDSRKRAAARKSQETNPD
jgi:hypothetical protein